MPRFLITAVDERPAKPLVGALYYEALDHDDAADLRTEQIADDPINFDLYDVLMIVAQIDTPVTRLYRLHHNGQRWIGRPV